MIEDVVDRIHDLLRPADEGGTYHNWASVVNNHYGEPFADVEFSVIQEFDNSQVRSLPGVIIADVRTEYTEFSLGHKTARHDVDVMVFEGHKDSETLRKKLRRTVRAVAMAIENDARTTESDISDFSVFTIDYSIPEENGSILVSAAVLRVRAIQSEEIASA